MTFDWTSIRALNGRRDKGFEELCAQLAHAEAPSGSTFVRKGTPDAGVECHAVLSDGTEWGWQSKYFDALGESQWSQIDRSVRTALVKHPNLVRYFVCVPLDRADARIQGRKSAKERWDDRVTKWRKWAADRNMSVEFIYWGSHELLELLARPRHVGRDRFWFGLQALDATWFTERLDEAVDTAGPRYTRELHVGLPIAWEFETFGRTDRFFDREKARARRIRRELTAIAYLADGADTTVDAGLAGVRSKVQEVLAALGAIDVQAAGPLPFREIAEKVRESEEAADEFARLLDERERLSDTNRESNGAEVDRSPHRRYPFRRRSGGLERLMSELRTARESFVHADRIADGALAILRGAAGTGKTHLLCDVAERRVSEGRPTVLLMGQRFMSNDEPWSQVLQQLDLSGLSAAEFVGALNAAAQAAGSRALVIIDALNEGAGRNIWPNHLAAFLAPLEKAPWVGVVLAVRSSFENLILPGQVRSRAAGVTHSGFLGHEYDATKTFFVHHGLELPSTPLLAPEFQNPQFLKTLCRGLQAKGERRLPRGFQGITAVFDLYLSAVNEQLALSLDFDSRTPLVRRAVDAVAGVILDSGDSWLSLAKAREVIDPLLPGRGFTRSLSQGLVAEGVLVEDVVRSHDGTEEVVVFVAYERLADHLMVSDALSKHLDISDPASAFAATGGLSFICDNGRHVSPGLIEALCIQIPERTGKELVSVAPGCADRRGLGDAFRQSLIWRSYKAFSEDTRQVLNRFCRSRHDLRDTLDVLLTVATLPDHPLNAAFLDRRLRKDSMPERDAWWSVYLHHAYGERGAADRLVDWASVQNPSTPVDDEAADLCAVALAWMLTSSNRFLRDRATTALVSLLTGRIAAVSRLVARFADVDDPYVVERLYGVAYGVAMRSHDPAAVGTLATCVYENVFASQRPPPHILLRDYARGVVERALYLGSKIDVLAEHIRPPYKSAWPTIPTEEDVEALMPDWSGGGDSGEVEWARSQIGFSVMTHDFARYVIGTNWSQTDWLSLRLVEPEWEPPPRSDDLLCSLVGEFSPEERTTWEEWAVADKTYNEALRPSVADWVAQVGEGGTSGGVDLSDLEAFARESKKANSVELEVLEAKRKRALVALEAALSDEHRQRLFGILTAKENEHESRRPPRFDLGKIQRYILRRVFDMGWTTKRFGSFDRYSIRDYGRDASKAERIGKKYQWIAYHEIMAFISDHYQYREQSREREGGQVYKGPWQGHFRDIDPSCTLRSVPGGTSWRAHAVSWWAAVRYDSWGDPDRPREWVLNASDLPKVEDLLVVTQPTDSSRWVNCQGTFAWDQGSPVDRESTDVERRELRYVCTGYLIRSVDAEAYLQWAKQIGFAGCRMPEAATVYRMFLGEHAWAPASHDFQQPYYGHDDWIRPTEDCPVKVRPVTREYLRERGGFDCSIDEGYAIDLPDADLASALGIRWSGHGADFKDDADRVVAQDPTVHSEGPSAMLFRGDFLIDFLERERLTICWAVRGEKRVISPGFGTGPSYPWLHLFGAYVFAEGRAKGFLNHRFDEPIAQSEPTAG